MMTRLQKVGDRWALIFEDAALERFGVDEHTEIVVTATDEGIFLKPVRFASDQQVEMLTGRIMSAHSETLKRLSL